MGFSWGGLWKGIVHGVESLPIAGSITTFVEDTFNTDFGTGDRDDTAQMAVGYDDGDDS